MAVAEIGKNALNGRWGQLVACAQTTYYHKIFKGVDSLDSTTSLLVAVTPNTSCGCAQDGC